MHIRCCNKKLNLNYQNLMSPDNQVDLIPSAGEAPHCIRWLICISRFDQFSHYYYIYIYVYYILCIKSNSQLMLICGNDTYYNANGIELTL